MITKALKLAGVETGELHQAGNGKEALAVLETSWIDLVFCDICMPVMDGEELVAALDAERRDRDRTGGHRVLGRQ